MIPFFGGFPVKLTTHIGEPIRARADETSSQLKARVQFAMREMVDTYQVKGGGVTRALAQRIGDKLSLVDKVA